MSFTILVLIVLAVIGILIGIGFLFSTRSRNGAASSVDSGSSSSPGGAIGSYGELRHQLLRETPENIPLEPISVSPENVVILVETYEAEVNNGGLDQFFFNSSGEYALETLQALELIKASKAASILQEACERFPNAQPPKDLLERRELLLSMVSPNGEAFDDLDRRFYDYEDNLSRLVEHYQKEDSL